MSDICNGLLAEINNVFELINESQRGAISPHCLQLSGVIDATSSFGSPPSPTKMSVDVSLFIQQIVGSIIQSQKTNGDSTYMAILCERFLQAGQQVCADLQTSTLILPNPPSWALAIHTQMMVQQQQQYQQQQQQYQQQQYQQQQQQQQQPLLGIEFQLSSPIFEAPPTDNTCNTTAKELQELII